MSAVSVCRAGGGLGPQCTLARLLVAVFTPRRYITRQHAQQETSTAKAFPRKGTPMTDDHPLQNVHDPFRPTNNPPPPVEPSHAPIPMPVSPTRPR